jgi:predicted Zn-dependent protease
MSSLDFDLDSQLSHLESVWRQAYESSVVARAELHALTSSPGIDASLLQRARDRLERAEAQKARITAKIDRLEENMINRS